MSSFDQSSLFPAPEEDAGVPVREENPVLTGEKSGKPLLTIPVGGIGSRLALKEIFRRLQEDAENQKNSLRFLIIDTDGETGPEPDTEPDGEEA